MSKQAFPTNTGLGQHQEEGMTLRDYFAAKIAQGIYARVNWKHEDVAELAYNGADEMMKERSK